MQTLDNQSEHQAKATQKSNGVVPGRNIILLSDGTGNSAAKLNKTNVWRLYDALKLNDGRQIAFYDDGVGTSGFKPLKLLGGAMGVGLAQNVRDLYRFLCEHYRAADKEYEGDRIYIIGFSRGAFTARILADLITSCGILDRTRTIPQQGFNFDGTPQLCLNTDEGINRAVRLAWKAYRRKYRPPLLSGLLRPIRDVLLGSTPKVGEFRDLLAHQADEPIEAIGVWDTVAAYGLPVEELSILVDKLFYKIRFDDHRLNAKVHRAYHALAIDDERESFHPLLWNEKDETDENRIQQVWFSGMHSDVGGGYPNGNLSLLSLGWMMNVLRRKPGQPRGLVFSWGHHDDVETRATATGTMHDSRSGLSIFYRYKPRSVEALINDSDHGVHLTRAKIHQSVLARVINGTDDYAPPGLPTSYDLVDDQGDLFNSARYEPTTNQVPRQALQERALSYMFRRRVNYFAMLFSTLALFAVPYYRPAVPGLKLSGLQTGVGWFLERTEPLLPGFLKGLTDAWTQSPYLFLALVAVFVCALFHARHIARRVHQLAEAGWWAVRKRPGNAPVAPKVGVLEIIESWIRRQSFLQRVYRWIRRIVIPGIVLIAVLFAGVLAGYRLVFHQPVVRNGLCNQAESISAGNAEFGKGFQFDVRTPCLDTGLSLVAGRSYTVDVKMLDKWKDGNVNASHSGLSTWYSRFRAPFILGLPARRHLSLPWAMLVAEIGRDSGELVPLRTPITTFRAAESGTMYLYVNDAIYPNSDPVPSMPGDSTRLLCKREPIESEALAGFTAWCGFYTNNHGAAVISVTSGP